MSASRVLFLLIFCLPLATVGIYEAFISSDRYESTSAIIITEERQPTSDLDLSLIGLSGSSSDKDALVLKKFIEGRGMLAYLDKELDLRSHFQSTSIDFWSRLAEDASLEKFLEHFLGYLLVEYDVESKILSFSFQGFDRQFSQKLLKKTLERSQQFIDRLNKEVTREQLHFFDEEIVKSEKRLRNAKDRLVSFQRKNKLLTTQSESEMLIATIGALERVLATKRSELDARLRVLDASAPQLQTLQLEIKALESQIGKEKQRFAGTSTNISLGELDAQFREIQLSLEFNTNTYKANLSALEQARLEAARRLKFLIVVTQPSLADESEYPARIYIIATWAIVLLLVNFVVSLMVAIIREHA